MQPCCEAECAQALWYGNSTGGIFSRETHTGITQHMNKNVQISIICNKQKPGYQPNANEQENGLINYTAVYPYPQGICSKILVDAWGHR